MAGTPASPTLINQRLPGVKLCKGVRTIFRRIRQFIALVTLLTLTSVTAAQEMPSVAGDSPEATALWQLLASPNHAALMRHTLAPGTGDPIAFDLGNCATQRNLSEEGRTQAQNAGALFKAQGIEQAVVFSSQWCRCMDTATLMDIGDVTALPIINSFFQNRQNAQPQTQALVQWLVTEKPDAPTLLVTHQVNITALTGVYPRSGEIVVVRIDDEPTDTADSSTMVTVVGRMSFQP